MRKIYLILVILVNCVFCKAQFTVIPTSTTDPLGYITNIGDTWIVQGWNNYFIKSSDMFDTYQQLNMPTNPNYRNVIEEADSKLFLASCNFGPTITLFYISNDTGNSWQLKFDTLDFYGDEFFMFDSLHGTLIGDFYSSINTIDGGINWSYNPTIGYSPIISEKYKDSIGFWTSTDKVHFTYDQFATTLTSNCPNLLNAVGGFILSADTFFLTSISMGNYFVYTTDSAKSWNSVEVSPFSGRGMYFFNGQEGYIVGRDYAAGQGAVYKTTDLGQSWTKYYTGIDCILTDIEFMNDSIALITGTNGVLLKWNKNGAPTNVIDMHASKELSLYPNPSSEEHTLSLTMYNLNELPKCQLMDISGRILNTYTMESKGQQQYTLINDVSTLPNGLFYYKVWTGDRTYSIRFVVAH